MSVIFIVLPLALVLAAFAVWAFIWAVRTGQMDDTQTPGVRLLLDDDDAEVRRPVAPDDDAPTPSS